MKLFTEGTITAEPQPEMEPVTLCEKDDWEKIHGMLRCDVWCLNATYNKW